MPLIIPQLDDRSYRDLLNEAIARIPVHTPEWTNFNDSDPGITLLQLFAFMNENLLFRSNLIPERNRLKFIQLPGEQVPLIQFFGGERRSASGRDFVTQTAGQVCLGRDPGRSR